MVIGESVVGGSIEARFAGYAAEFWEGVDATEERFLKGGHSPEILPLDGLEKAERILNDYYMGVIATDCRGMEH